MFVAPKSTVIAMTGSTAHLDSGFLAHQSMRAAAALFSFNGALNGCHRSHPTAHCPVPASLTMLFMPA
jgi:hypothetical protein